MKLFKRKPSKGWIIFTVVAMVLQILAMLLLIYGMQLTRFTDIGIRVVISLFIFVSLEIFFLTKVGENEIIR